MIFFISLFHFLLLLFLSSAIQLRILHTNDLHSRFDLVTSRGSRCRSKDSVRGACFGGFSRLKRLVEDLQSSESKDPYRKTLFLNAGDIFQGTIWYTLFKWPIVANLTNGIGFTASSLGNHEFDDGVWDLESFAKSVDYPLLACNLNFTDERSLGLEILPSTIVQLGGGQKVGIIGYVTPETKEIASTGNVIFKEEIHALRAEVFRLRTELDVNIIIALGHSGFEKDLEIAREVEGISVVVGGHTNTLLWNGPKKSYEKNLVRGKYPTVVRNSITGNPVLILQTNGYGLYLGKIDINFDDDFVPSNWTNSNPIPITQGLESDKDLDIIIEAYKRKLETKMKKVVGKTLHLMDGGRPKCRLEECSFGNLLADAMRSELKVPIAVINSGGIKGSFDPNENEGDITLEDIFRAMPWSNTIDVITVPGSTIIMMMEHSVSQYNDIDPSGRFLQVSGLQVNYDVSQSLGRRVVSIFTNDGIPLEPFVHYQIAINSFMAQGGDGYVMIPDTLIYHKNTGFLDKDLFVSYIKTHSPLSLPIPGRLKFIKDSQVHSSSDTLYHAFMFSTSPVLTGALMTIWNLYS
ncbi:snake venom 5'-nucleotidase isoform X1 [Lepeophtheirus salmonis]|uniref:snake venom 5'-nucleotidase isoform X1 n=1 Tax=Lepeophtheirus salmonis TaxID=72036 RepID=UPI001AE8BAF1|nr:snake venom 5'-nucleotidase-like isoform X1 [Lepeophtheirus salmonis]